MYRNSRAYGLQVFLGINASSIVLFRIRYLYLYWAKALIMGLTAGVFDMRLGLVLSKGRILNPVISFRE